MRALIRQLTPAIVALTVFTVALGVGYPLLTTVIAQVGFGQAADGSLIEVDGRIVGSDLIGQPFVSAQYFHPRPSAAGAGYDGATSSGSNLGPLNPDLLDAVERRVAEYRSTNRLDDQVRVPVDAVTASGSGLDPHISVANAQLQAPRVADVRGIELAAVLDAVDAATDEPAFGVLGEPAVRVLALNLMLDDRFGAVD
jgi:potassium-transporting ATPase KdpC subunit